MSRGQIARQWNTYMAAVLEADPTVDELTLARMRIVYYSGAAAVWNLMIHAAENTADEVLSRAELDAVDAIGRELDAFSSGVRKVLADAREQGAH